MELQPIKMPRFYPSDTQLWVEMPVDIIRKAAEEHEECMKSLDDARMQKQPKHIGTGKTSRPKNPGEITSNASAFQKVQQVESEDCVKLNKF